MEVSAINQVTQAIISGQFTNEQLDAIQMAVKFARGQVRSQIKALLRVGDQVSWTSSKTGQNSRGTVQKIAIKFVTVQTAAGVWRVPANMLTKVEKEEWTPETADYCDKGSRHHY